MITELCHVMLTELASDFIEFSRLMPWCWYVSRILSWKDLRSEQEAEGRLASRFHKATIITGTMGKNSYLISLFWAFVRTRFLCPLGFIQEPVGSHLTLKTMHSLQGGRHQASAMSSDSWRMSGKRNSFGSKAQ